MKIRFKVSGRHSVFFSLVAVAAILSGCAKGGPSGLTPPASGSGTGTMATSVSDNSSATGKNLRIVASFYPMYIMAINVARGVPGVSVETLAPPTTGCLHDYSVTTADMKKLEGASIFVANGAGMETFLEKVASRYPSVRTVRLSDGLDLIDEKGSPNPHVWVGISGAIAQVENLGRFLAASDPVHAEAYRANAAAYVSRLSALRDRMAAGLAPYKGREIITFHEAFPYFAREFGLKIAAVIEREPGSEPSAREVASTIETVRSVGMAALFAEPQYSPSAAQTVARETGAKIYSLDPAVTGPDSPDAYLAIMEANLATLKEALAARPSSN
jgi:zinc transport system substrate-binding protein